MDLALNNLHWLMYHTTKPKQTKLQPFFLINLPGDREPFAVFRELKHHKTKTLDRFKTVKSKDTEAQHDGKPQIKKKRKTKSKLLIASSLQNHQQVK